MTTIATADQVLQFWLVDVGEKGWYDGNATLDATIRERFRPTWDRAAELAQINAARSESYQQLADDNNLPVDEVAKMAGQKLVARAQPGEYVQGLNGQWLRK